MTRYKVTALWPGCKPLKLNDILHSRMFGDNEWYCLESDTNGAHAVSALDVQECTANFTPLKWYEGLKPDEMPEYVECKIIKGVDSDNLAIFLELVSPAKWVFLDPQYIPGDKRIVVELDNNGKPIKVPVNQYSTSEPCYIEPATRTDYENYINSKK